jgi:proto-oncogene serine/threonine-protein kinase Pim-2
MPLCCIIGGELYDYIQTKGKLEESEVRRLFTQIVSAVQHCHKRGIVHRGNHSSTLLTI